MNISLQAAPGDRKDKVAAGRSPSAPATLVDVWPRNTLR